MKKFGEVLEEFIANYKKQHPEENLESRPEIVLIQHWRGICQNYTKEDVARVLSECEFISLQNGELKIKISHASERFILDMDIKNIVLYLNNTLRVSIVERIKLVV